MKERPILFNDEMVRALLDGRKTQTRRAMKPQPEKHGAFWEWGGAGWSMDSGAVPVVPGHSMAVRCPYGQPGDRLWVREAHAFVPEPAYRRSVGIYQQINPADDYEACVYRENFDRARSFPWRPSIHMPRWACRLLLEVTAVRVERLQDITEADALAEGVDGEAEAAAAGLPWHDNPRRAFRFLWRRIGGPESWDANPWVWVVEFRYLEAKELTS